MVCNRHLGGFIILALQVELGAEHQHILIQIHCFSLSTRNIKAHRPFGPNSIFESSTRSDPGSNFWISCCMHAWSISAQWLGQLAKSRRPQLAFQMCSTKSLTSFISSFSIIKLSSLEQCSQQLDDYWTCCQRSVSLPIFLSHKSQVTVNLK